MEYRQIAQTDLKVSSLMLGTWVFGGHFWGGANDKHCIDAVDYAIDRGINCIDTAPIYSRGQSEIIVGKALKGKRKNVILATKCGLISGSSGIEHNLKRDSIINEVEQSLRRLQTDYIDIYQCHWPDDGTPMEETFNALKVLQEQGKIRYVGVSNFGAKRLREAQQYLAIISTQDQYSILERGIEESLIPAVSEANIALFCYGSLAGGILTGKYIQEPIFNGADARNMFYKFYEGQSFQSVQSLLERLRTVGKPLNQLAINWVRQQPQVTSVIVGCRNPKQVEQNIQAVQWKLSEEELEMIDCALEEFEVVS